MPSSEQCLAWANEKIRGSMLQAHSLTDLIDIMYKMNRSYFIANRINTKINFVGGLPNILCVCVWCVRGNIVCI